MNPGAILSIFMDNLSIHKSAATHRAYRYL